uniref:Uncharacterized protein n=1 Tax=Spongospora subterranea TaxID=70186 RepID=A0A0H5QYK4_9EUKA|eukprot:CRZ00654.1 hypothetical protein [Spongospora subterranea]
MIIVEAIGALTVFIGGLFIGSSLSRLGRRLFSPFRSGTERQWSESRSMKRAISSGRYSPARDDVVFISATAPSLVQRPSFFHGDPIPCAASLAPSSRPYRYHIAIVAIISIIYFLYRLLP